MERDLNASQRDLSRAEERLATAADRRAELQRTHDVEIAQLEKRLDDANRQIDALKDESSVREMEDHIRSLTKALQRAVRCIIADGHPL